IRLDAVPGLDSVISPCCHHAPAGQVGGLWAEAVHRALRKSTAKPENDGGSLVLLLPVSREMDMNVQNDRRGLVGVRGLLEREVLDRFLGLVLGAHRGGGAE